MIIVRENLVELLNMDLELEDTAALQYINHSARLTGAVYRTLMQVLKGYAHDKVKNAIILAEQIHSLGGLPSVRISTVHIADDNEGMLLRDLEDEEDAVRRLKIRITQAEQLQETALSQWLRTVLRVDQQHEQYLKKQVSATRRHRAGSSFTLPGVSDFSQVWAEKAAQVPVRVKKVSHPAQGDNYCG